MLLARLYARRGNAAGTTPSARRQILSSGTWVAVSQLAPFLATAALSVVAGRVLGAQLLGQQSLIAFGAALVGSVIVGSLTDASIQSMASQGTMSAAGATGLGRRVLVAHVLAGLVAAGSLAAYGVVRDQLLLAWLVVAVSALTDAAGWGYGSVVIATAGWGPVARRRLVAQLAAIGLGVGAVIAGLGVTGIFAASAIASAALLLSLRRLAPRTARPPAFALPRPVVRLWGLFAAGEVLTQVVGKRIEFLFLAAYSSSREIAAFSIAIMVVSVVIAIPASLFAAAMPAMATASGAGDEDRARASLSCALRVTVVASLPLAASVAAIGPSLVTAVYGSQFGRAAALVPLAAIGAVLAPAGWLCTTYWSALGKLRPTLLAGVVGGVIDLGVAFALVPAHGASGAVVAGVAGQCVDAVCVVGLTWRAVGRFRLGATGWLSTLVASVCGAAGARQVTQLVGGLPGAILGAVCFVAIFGAAAAILGTLRAPALTEADGRWLADSLPTRLGVLVTWPLVGRYGWRNTDR